MTGLKMELVPTGAAHAGVISALLSLAFPEGWSEKSVGDVLAMPGTFGWIALQNETPVGVVLMQGAVDQGDILTIATHPDHRRAKVASKLLEAAIGSAHDLGLKSIFLEVAEDNAPALAFYRKHGFNQLGLRKGYYRKRNGSSVNAIVFELAL